VGSPRVAALKIDLLDDDPRDGVLSDRTATETRGHPQRVLDLLERQRREFMARSAEQRIDDRRLTRPFQ
jgi:hypothetical protein